MGWGRFIAPALGPAFRVIAIAGVAGGMYTAAQAQSPPGPAVVNPFAARLLEAQNRERDRAGLPRLAWSPRLAQDAQAWAVEIARRGALQHADDRVRRGAGENLWKGSAGYYSAETMIAGFLSERDRFRPGTFPAVSATGNWADVGHYTQIIWPATTEVGCAVAKGATEDFLVCRYNPAGNIFGQKVGQ